MRGLAVGALALAEIAVGIWPGQALHARLLRPRRANSASLLPLPLPNMQPPADDEGVLGSERKTKRLGYDISNDSSTGERSTRRARARRACVDVDGAAAGADRAASPARIDTAAIGA